MASSFIVNPSRCRPLLSLGTTLYGVLYIDPPWQPVADERSSWLNKSPDNHYPTLPLGELAALKLPAAKDCALFLWATGETDPAAHRLIETWGFQYRACGGL